MKIARLQSYLIPGDPRPNAWCPRIPFVFVRLETTCGVVGWGEGYTFTHREYAVVATIEALAEHLIGLDLANTRYVATLARSRFGEQQMGQTELAAASAIEIAMWDALAKAHGLPVHALNGRDNLTAIDLYANIWTNQPHSVDQIAQVAADQAAAGFSAIKMYPFRLGESVAEGREKVRAVREAVGEGVGIAIDIWRFPDRALAVQICRSLEDFNILWFEDPFPPAHSASYAYLAAKTGVPLVAGETLCHLDDFDQLICSGAVGLINPDICVVGGFHQMNAVATLASKEGVRISPHNYNSMTVGLAASATAAAGIHRVGLVEYFPIGDDDLDGVVETRLRPTRGQVKLSDAAGLGVSFDDAKMEQFKICLL